MSLRYSGEHVIRDHFSPVDVESAIHPHGDDIEKQFRLKRDEHLNAIYEEVPGGDVDINQYINSFKNGCSLKAILDRCSLMPAREKIAYLQQTDQGYSADMSAMPKDGTEAQIMLAKLKAEHPEIVERIKNGESFDKILADMIPSAAPAESAPYEPVTNKESEVTA